MNSSLSVNNIKTIKYISLKKDIIQRCLLKTQLKGLPCEKKWIYGVRYDANNPIYEKYTKNGFASYLLKKEHQMRQKGVAGCWIAHSHAIEDITESDGISIILEDDFVCQSGFFEKAINMIQEFDLEFDIIIFDPNGNGPLPEHSIRKDVYTNNGGTWPLYWGTHCLFINNISVPKIIDIKMNTPISDYDGFLLTNSELKIYLFYTHKCTAMNFGSNINQNYSILTHIKGFISWLIHRLSKSDYIRRVR